tara:strand:+ start:2849 stop:3235 length:387 start_codon:yes stop_codon:yes gene_type:complete
MEQKQKKFIKVTYYNEPYVEVYELGSDLTGINIDKLCEEQRNYETFNQIEFKHHGQFREILIDNTWGWNDYVDPKDQFKYENYRVEQIDWDNVPYDDPKYILSMDKDSKSDEPTSTSDLVWEKHPEFD